MQNCIDVVQASRARPATKLALDFLILTASRSGEVRGALWDEIEFQGGETAKTAKAAIWNVPATRMKAKKPHHVPLSARALEILTEAEALRGASGLVFPSRRDKPLSDKTLSKLVKEEGFDVDVHGFRTSFRMWAQEQTNFPREVAEAALGMWSKARLKPPMPAQIILKSGARCWKAGRGIWWCGEGKFFG